MRFNSRLVDLSARDRAIDIRYHRMSGSRYSGPLSTLRCVVCFCPDSLKNVHLGDVINLKGEIQKFTKFFNRNETYPTVLELPRSMESARVRDWWLSRHAVLDVLTTDSNQGFSKQNLILSISHTSNAAVAILSVEGSAVGVDIEPSTREISERTLERISHLEDIKVNQRLDCWMIKEAVLKASSASAVNEVAIISKLSRSQYIASVDGCKFRVVLQTVPWGYRVAMATG